MTALRKYSHLSKTDVQASWEADFESVTGVTRIHELNEFVLYNALAACMNRDTYLSSPNYFIFTGRRGLWLYQHDDVFLVVCWHPNVRGQILIFSPFSNMSYNKLSDVLAVMPVPPNGTHLARVENVFQYDAQAMRHGNRFVTMEPYEERVLDWRYPAYILSTEDVSSLKGKRFMRVRNRVNHFRQGDVKILPLDMRHHSVSVGKLLHKWANAHATSPEEYIALYDPHENLLFRSIEDDKGLSGLLVLIDEEIQAVSLWDVSCGLPNFANLFVNISNPVINGLSEFTMVKTCQHLARTNISYLNVGGSETEGLDVYKRKFRPVRCLDMSTINVTFDYRSNIGTSAKHVTGQEGRVC